MCVFERCLEGCKQKPGRLVLPDSLDERALMAAARLKAEGLAEPMLIGNPMALRDTAQRAGLRVSDIWCIDPESKEFLEQNAWEYQAICAKKNKPVSDEDAVAFARLPTAAGAMLVRRGAVDLGVAGNLSSTADVLRAGLRVIGTSPKSKTVFSVFFMIAPGGEHLLVFADCAVIPDPTAAQVADIALGAADALRRLMDEEPRVALLSSSTKGSAEYPAASKMQEALELIKQRDAKLIVDGELQFDAAVVPGVAKQKAPDSPIAGRANVLVFPSIDAGNISYKVAQRLCGYTALGPFLLGFAKGWHDLSRGCSTEDIYKIAVVGMGLSRGLAAH